MRRRRVVHLADRNASSTGAVAVGDGGDNRRGRAPETWSCIERGRPRYERRPSRTSARSNASTRRALPATRASSEMERAVGLDPFADRRRASLACRLGRLVEGQQGTAQPAARTRPPTLPTSPSRSARRPQTLVGVLQRHVDARYPQRGAGPERALRVASGPAPREAGLPHAQKRRRAPVSEKDDPGARSTATSRRLISAYARSASVKPLPVPVGAPRPRLAIRFSCSARHDTSRAGIYYVSLRVSTTRV